MNTDICRYNGKQRLDFNGERSDNTRDEGQEAHLANEVMEAQVSDEGREPEIADAATVWRLFDSGWSVRILHPQRWSDKLWKLMSALETYFGTCMGCNAYLTPKASQGFAPHWDDIDAFIVQLEGKKRCARSMPCGGRNRGCMCEIGAQGGD